MIRDTTMTSSVSFFHQPLSKLIQLVAVANSTSYRQDAHNRSVRFTETIESGGKTAVRFTRVFNNDVINKNTAIRFIWFQPRFQNSFETFKTTSGGSF